MKIFKSKRYKQSYKRAKELLSKMTLEEKIGQLSMFGMGDVADLGLQAKSDLPENIRRGRAGSIIQRTTVKMYDISYELQRIAVEESRLGIPMFINSDLLHGFETVFPMNIAMACSFDMEKIERATRVMAREASCVGIQWTNAPMLDLCHDIRWGRVSESAGEDPYLASQIAKASVNGFQNYDLSKKDSIMACMKHFIGYGACEGGRDYDTAVIDDYTLYNYYYTAFREALNCDVASVMTSFNSINGIPMTVNKKLLKELLRDKGFNGIILSDAVAINEVVNHGVAEDFSEANRLAVEATLDVDLGGVMYNDYLQSLVEKGAVSESIIDECVLRVLTLKYFTGLMDDPFKNYRKDDIKNIYCDEFLNIALELAEECAVLLKNDDNILPISKNKKVAIIGPFADSEDLLGCWHCSSEVPETIYNELKKEFSDIQYAKGCDEYDSDEKSIEKACVLAKNSDVVIMCLGQNSEECGEATSMSNPSLSDTQTELLKRISEVNKNVVLVVCSGRPLIITEAEKYSKGILAALSLGSMEAKAIANIVVGKTNPSGKLAMAIPKNVGQIPLYYNRLNTGRPYDEKTPDYRFCHRYIDDTQFPLYPFGYGLSYSNFEYSNVELEKFEDKIVAKVKIKNTSDTDGTEIVQLYIRDVVAEASRPIKELKDFKRVFIKTKRQIEVSFDITYDKLSYYHQDKKFYYDKGKFEVFIGTNCLTKNKNEFTIE